MEFDYIDISGIDNNLFQIAETKKYAGRQAPSRARQLVKAGDIVFSTVRTYLKNIARVTPEYDGQIASTGFCVLRPAEPEFSKYLFYYVQYEPFLNQLAKFQRGTSYPAVRDGDVFAQLIPVPPKSEAIGIVAEIEKQFSRLDEAVANLKRVKANLKRYKAAVLKAAVEGKLTEEWRKAHPDVEPASELLKRILAERRAKWKERGKYKEPIAVDAPNLRPLAKGWIWALVDQLSIVVRGASPRPAGHPKYFGGNIPWITVGPLTADDQPYLRSVPETVTEAGREASRDIEPETLLLTNSGATLGIPKITLIGGCINDGVAALLNVDYPLKLYLFYFLRSQTERLRAINQGAAQPNLNTTIIKDIPVPLPPVSEQHQIVTELERRLSVLDELDAVASANGDRAERLRHSLLQKAFSGRLITTGPRIDHVKLTEAHLALES